MMTPSAGDRLTILHTINSFRWTGVAEPTVQLACRQQQDGHRVVMAVEAGGDLEKKIEETGLEQSPGLMSHAFRPVKTARQLFAMRRALEALRPDVVHAHLLHDHAMAALARRGMGPRAPLLVRTFHREKRPRRNALVRRLVRHTDGLIAVSHSMRGRLRETYRRDGEDVIAIGGAVDVDRFAPGADPMTFRREWGIAEEAPVVGLLSRLREARGIFWLLDAAEEIVKRVPEARIVYCGRGRHAKKLKEAIGRHPCKTNIVYAGYVPPDRLCEAYAAFDVHCLLGPGNDGTCRAALESMACARPLIAADLGALHDLMEAGAGGRLVAPDDVAALAEATVYYLSDRDRAHAEGEAARERVASDYTVAQQAAAVEAFYRRLLVDAT